MVHQTVYLSKAAFDFKEEQLTKILEKAHVYNSERGITGVLIYNAGYFLQLLEGPKLHVLELYARISRDIRHNQVTTLLQGNQAERIYKDWSMAYANLDHFNDQVGVKVKGWFDQAVSGNSTLSNIDLLKLIMKFQENIK